VNARYRTIVADPPWAYPGGFGTVPDRPFPGKRDAGTDTSGTFVKRPIPYQTLSVDEIATLPVADLAEPDAHLYLWTTQRYLHDAPNVARAWGFKPSCVLVWCKPPAGVHGGTFITNVEFILFCRRGSLAAKQRVYGQWYEWKRGPHSTKPDAFIDLVEATSPGPYVELFARRARFGWDYWGDQSLGTAEIPSEAA
jgi:N6-adenosine-specific RNA methylase IME4